jgi:hypothetical protein
MDDLLLDVVDVFIVVLDVLGEVGDECGEVLFFLKSDQKRLRICVGRLWNGGGRVLIGKTGQ